MLIARLLLVLQFWDGKPTYRKSWAGNLLVWTDLTLGLSFEVKRWFIGFGDLSFRRIQINNLASNTAIFASILAILAICSSHKLIDICKVLQIYNIKAVLNLHIYTKHWILLSKMLCKPLAYSTLFILYLI